jgi:hypothetical protein
MARLREWILRLLSVWRPRRNDRDLEDELRSHLPHELHRRGAIV